MSHLVASLSLSDKNEGIGAYDGEAEVDKDDGAFRADVPERFEREEEEDELERSHNKYAMNSVPGFHIQVTYFHTET